MVVARDLYPDHLYNRVYLLFFYHYYYYYYGPKQRR